MQRAFSLVELSIVLVILGLLTGGILAGQSLIRAAELRSVSTEYGKYVTATQTFRDKYFAAPGDFRDATRIWLRQVGTADCVTNSSAATNSAGACDGNGNGVLSDAAAASQASEAVQYWRQLALAGLLEGTYTGIVGAGGVAECVLGTNCPKAKLGSAGWGVRSFTTYFTGNAGDYAGDYGNMYDLGTASVGGTPQGAALKPEESWNIDTKLDDGKPSTGKINVNRSCANDTSATDTNATYKLDNAGAICMMHFLRAF